MLCASLVVPSIAHADTVAFRGATVYPVSGPRIANGVVVVRDGRIEAVGPAGNVAIPKDARVRDVTGKVIIPGLVDTHSHVGVYPRPAVGAHGDGNESTTPLTPHVRALDAIWPADPGIRMALAGGVTTANIMPGSGNVVGGQTAYVKYRGTTVETMLIKGADGAPVLGGMKMANGENPKRTHGPKGRAPMTRMGVAYLERKLLLEAVEYREKWQRYEEKLRAHEEKVDAAQTGEDEGEEADADDPGQPPEPPGRNLRLEPMVEVLDGARIVHHHTHRADDILTVLRIADEFGHRVVLQHATEAYLVADDLAKREVPVSAIILDSPGGKHEAVGLAHTGPGVLERAGVKVAIHTDVPVTSSTLFLRSAALAVRGGMTEAGALRALTLHPAEMLDLGDRVGSLEPGKDADLVVLSGPPFALRTHVLETWIDGALVWDRSDPKDRLYQTGGFQVADRYPTMEADIP